MTLRKPEALISFLCIVSFAFSCSPLYVPSARTFNHFSSKHEVNATGMMDLSGFEGRAAFSITDHWFASSSFSKSIYGLANDPDTNAISGTEGSHNHKMFEIGGGHFRKIANRYFEFSGGFSLGKSKVYEDLPSSDGVFIPAEGTYPSRVISGAYNRFYLQGGGLITGDEELVIGLVLRVSSVKFSRIESQTEWFTFDKRNRFYFFEPAIDLRLNIPNTPVYLLANHGFSIRVDNIPRQRTNRGRVPETWVINGTLGIGIHLNKQKR